MIARSILTNGQRRLLLVLVGLGAFMLATSGFLFTTHPSDESLPVFYQVVLLSHISGGLLVLVPMVVFVLWHLRRAMKMRNRRAVATGVFLASLMVVLAASGLTVMTQANSLAFRWVFRTHQIGAVLVLLTFLLHRFSSTNRPKPAGVAFGLGGVLVLFGVLVAGLAVTREPVEPYEFVSSVPALGPAASEGRDPFVPFVPPSEADADSPFFPSPATTGSGGFLSARILTRDEVEGRERLAADMKKYGFAVSQQLGAEMCSRCHMDAVDQWAASAHRFSSLNNLFYLVPIEELRERHGNRRSQWCAGCHDPAILFPGNMTKEFDRESPEAQAGLTCLACHAIDRIHNISGNGNYNLSDERESPYLLSESETEAGRFVHDQLVKAKPDVHKRQMLKPFFRDSAFCATCHKVSLDVPVNDYRFLRGQNEFDAHHDSGVTRVTPRTFYLPERARTCQDCHMPREPAIHGDVSAKGGTVKSHRFLTVNTGLPAIRGDADTLRRTEEFLREGKLRIDVFAIVRSGAEPEMPLDRNAPGLVPGEAVTFEVVVRNLGVGHNFPGGTTDSNEAWVDFQVTDDRGLQIYRSGEVGPDHHVDPDAHFYRAVFVDGEGRRANRRNPSDFRTLVYAKVIGPGTADVVRYEVRIPERGDPGRIRIRAALMWRKFNREYTEFVFERLGRPVPMLPITEVAADEVVLPVGSGTDDSAAPGPDGEDSWVRLNDHGIALFLQGDTRRAAQSFRRVLEVAPEKVDGYRNLARVALRDGNLDGAFAWLEKAREVAPEDPQNAYFFGRALRAAGYLDRAEAAYVASLGFFPEDRSTWRELGKVRFLSEDFEGALSAFLRVLEIDPEDVDAHYHRMKCYQGLGDAAAAAEARKAYLKYKVDDNAPKVARTFLLTDRAMNREAQPIHIHR